MRPGVIGSTVSPQRYDAKSAPGISSTRVSVGSGFEVRRPRPTSSWGCPRRAAGSRRVRAVQTRRNVHQLRARSRCPRRRVPAPASGARRTRRGERVHAEAESTATPSANQRDGASRAAQREPEARRLGEHLNSRPSTDGSPYGLAPTATDDPISMTNTKNARWRHRTSARRNEREHRQRKAHRDQPQVLRVPDARLDPGTDLVAAVEEPVAKAAEHLARQRGLRHGRERLGELQDVEAVPLWIGKPDDPPHRRRAS